MSLRSSFIYICIILSQLSAFIQSTLVVMVSIDLPINLLSIGA